MRESQEEFAKVSKLDRGKLAIHKRCIVDSCIQGAYEQWRQFGHKLRLAAQLESINSGSAPRVIVPNPEEARALAELILADNPELSVDVSVQSRGNGPNEIITPEVGIISPIELFVASVQELNSCIQDGRRRKPLERHPDGYTTDPDDGNDAMFGRRFIDKREKRKDPEVEPVPYQPMLPPKPIDPKDQTVEVEFGLYGIWQTFTVPKTITEEEVNALATSSYGPPIATPDFTASPYQTQQFRFFPDVSHGAPIWITCRQIQGRTKHTFILRVSSETTHEEIEQTWLETCSRLHGFPCCRFNCLVIGTPRDHALMIALL
jgi:hypothetical protein